MISAFGVEHGEVSKGMPGMLKLMRPHQAYRVAAAEAKGAKKVDAIRRGKGAKTGLRGLMQPHQSYRVAGAEKKAAAKVDRVRRGR